MIKTKRNKNKYFLIFLKKSVYGGKYFLSQIKVVANLELNRIDISFNTDKRNSNCLYKSYPVDDTKNLIDSVIIKAVYIKV